MCVGRTGKWIWCWEFHNYMSQRWIECVVVCKLNVKLRQFVSVTAAVFKANRVNNTFANNKT